MPNMLLLGSPFKGGDTEMRCGGRTSILVLRTGHREIIDKASRCKDKSENTAKTVICLRLFNRCQLGIVHKLVYGRKDDQHPLSPTTPTTADLPVTIPWALLPDICSAGY